MVDGKPNRWRRLGQPRLSGIVIDACRFRENIPIAWPSRSCWSVLVGCDSGLKAVGMFLRDVLLLGVAERPNLVAAGGAQIDQQGDDGVLLQRRSPVPGPDTRVLDQAPDDVRSRSEDSLDHVTLVLYSAV